jgi:membrane fusion protein, multidrug efflux system
MRRPILLWSLALGAAVLWGVQRARTGRPQRGDTAGATPAASKTTADATGRGAGAKQQQPLNVSAVRAVPAPFTEHISATGTLRAEEGVELQAETGGRLRSINFTEGSRVKKGDLLIKLTDDDLQAMLVRASSRLNLAVQRRSRIERLFRDGVANQEDYDSAINEMAVQEAEVGVIRAQIAKTEIRAPFDGVVGLRFISEGAFVNANARMATLQAVDRLKLDFSVPERFAERIAPGTVVEFSAGGRARRQGKVSAVEPRLDAGTRTLTARAVIANPDGLLRPGSFVSVDVTLETFPNAIVLPSVSVVPGPTERSVFVVSDGRAVRRAVQTGTRTESTVHIVSGVQPGDLVITSGLQQMRQGLPVNPIMADLKQQETQGPNSATPKPAQAAAAVREKTPST